MNSVQASALLEKYRNNTLTEQEHLELENWYFEYYEAAKPLRDPQVYHQLIKELDYKVLQMVSDPAVSKPKTFKICRKLRIKIMAAAAMVAVISIALLFFTATPSLIYPKTHYIGPGTNKATLTLGDGNIIELSKFKTGIIIHASKLIYNDGEELSINNISSTEQTITTPRGGQYQIVLPDGTRVWLNAASSLTYSTSLNERGEDRRVKLNGEAYFEVNTSSIIGQKGLVKRPFTVITSQQELKVLGTHFNINSYADEPHSKTALLEGSVSILTPSLNEHPIILVPGQQFIRTGSSGKVQHIDPDEAIAWKNGEFMFRNESLSSIMRKIARWYDVEVTYLNADVANQIFGGTISKYNDISQVLSVLEATGAVKFELHGRTVSVNN